MPPIAAAAANSDASAGNRGGAAQHPAHACVGRNLRSLIETIDILTAQEAVLFAMETAGEAMGSYGGALYLDASGNVLPENPAHSQDRLITQDHICRLQKPLPIPEADIWFETVWAQYRKEHPQSSHSELR